MNLLNLNKIRIINKYENKRIVLKKSFNKDKPFVIAEIGHNQR